ncbi:MFS transporter [Facilibium subflavum]|uniref:hypothetical protein n=1 Tax=Facilibium subflavum TaxID=2219058 RepID=UPI000E658230|nr:hypothetical protein [Facilibium subflavum]
MRQNKQITLSIFYLYVALLGGTDLMLLTGMIWFSLKITGSPMLIGLLLSISVFLPFVTKKLLRKKQTQTKTVKRMAAQRVLIYLTILLVSFIFRQHQLLNLIVWGVLLGLSNLITNSALEKQNTLIAMSGMLKYELAARVMQTMVQIGACLGSFLGGVFIYYLGIFSFAQAVSAISLVLTLSLYLLWQDPDAPMLKGETNKSSNQAGVASFDRQTASILLVFSIGIGMIGFHISSFNILMPMIFQKVYLWNAVLLGSASAAAGVGSFCASLIKNSSKVAVLLAIMLALGDLLAGLSGQLIVVMSACFLIGFAMNYCRIALRQKLMLLATNTHEADKIASFSTGLYMCFQGLSPVVVALIIAALGEKGMFASYLFGFVGIVTALVIILSISVKKLSRFCEPIFLPHPNQTPRKV